jgi:hypothetical protein
MRHNIVLAALIFVSIEVPTGVSFAHAQQMETDAQRSARLLRQDNITATGATVPLPGASKGAGETPLDRQINKRNDQIDQSICSNCR